MSELAETADVAIQTIYNVVGSKSAVLSLVLDETVSGPDAPRPVSEFMRERTEHAFDAAGVIDVLGDWFADVHPRSLAVWQMIRDAAAVDPEVAALEAERERVRLRNYGYAAQILTKKAGGRLRLDEGETAAAIWAIGHPEVYRRLVTQGEWSPDRYRQWVVDSLRGALLPES